MSKQKYLLSGGALSVTDAKLRSAKLKVYRATKHINELNHFLSKKQPFSYVLERDTQTKTCSTYAKKDIAVVDNATLICGDALYNLRSALDHAYWEIVSPVAVGNGAESAIQFPFSKTAARLQEAIKNRLAHKVSPEFFAFILALQPHGEPGGNELLYLLHDENGIDKHRTLIPVADYKRLSSDVIRQQVPDFPHNLINVGFGQNKRDVAWTWDSAAIARISRKNRVAGIVEQKLNVPVQITFLNGRFHDPRPLVPTLHQLTNLTSNVIDRMTAFV